MKFYPNSLSESEWSLQIDFNELLKYQFQAKMVYFKRKNLKKIENVKIEKKIMKLAYF